LALDNGASEFAEQARTLRLSDAEKIASDRLDSTSISSLKAALAGVSAKDPLPSTPRLVERIDAAAKLAAEATAAAQAVETLKRLLQAQLATNPAAATGSGGRVTSVGGPRHAGNEPGRAAVSRLRAAAP